MALHDALAHSINTIAVKVSLDVGREKVLETMKKLGITRLKKTCSLALGDQGLTPLEHTENYAVFASGGLDVHAYAIEEIKGLASGEVLYNHDRDAPPRKQIFQRKSIEMLNTMMQQVVQAGTARAAILDFTYAIGKTGTSSNFRDAWFMGMTGQYVAGVWLGNDDFTPMARVTGGSFPAQTWHNFIVAAHDTDNIAKLPGIAVHPVQVAEQARLAAAAAQNAAANPESYARPGRRERQGHVNRDEAEFWTRSARCSRTPAASRQATRSLTTPRRRRAPRRSQISPKRRMPTARGSPRPRQPRIRRRRKARSPPSATAVRRPRIRRRAPVV